MKKLTGANGEWTVKGAELLDWKSLASVSDPVFLKYKGEICSSTLPGVEPGDETGLTAVLTETKARSTEELRQNIRAIEQCLSAFQTYTPVCFTDKPEEYSKYWAIRSGIFLPWAGRGNREQHASSKMWLSTSRTYPKQPPNCSNS